MKRAAGAVAVGFTLLGLSGCAPAMLAVDAADLSVTGLSAATVKMAPEPAMVIMSTKRETVAKLRYFPVMTGVTPENKGCSYDAFLVNYVRDWDETIQTGGTERVVKGNPDKVAGQAMLAYRLNCPGKAPVPVAMAGLQNTSGSGYAVILDGVNALGHTDAEKQAIQKAFIDLRTQATFVLLPGNPVPEAKYNSVRNSELITYGVRALDYTNPPSDGVPPWLPQVVGVLAKAAPADPDIKAALQFDQQLLTQVAPSRAEAIQVAVQ